MTGIAADPRASNGGGSSWSMVRSARLAATRRPGAAASGATARSAYRSELAKTKSQRCGAAKCFCACSKRA